MKTLLFVHKSRNLIRKPFYRYKLSIHTLMEEVKPVVEKQSENWDTSKLISVFGIFELSRFRGKDPDLSLFYRKVLLTYRGLA